MNDETPKASAFAPAELPPAIQTINGKDYMTDGTGSLVPVGLVKAKDKLIDEVVRKIISYGLPLSGQVERFKGHTFKDIEDLLALLQQDYGVTLGGKKGNATLLSFDGLFKVKVTVADYIDYGPEIVAAKALIDEYLNDLASVANDELRAIVTLAFNTDKPGKINRAEVQRMLQWDIKDPRWLRAMDAIRDSIRVVGSKAYVNLYQRPTQQDEFKLISIDLAAG
jgi:hypothetical protein